MVPLISDVELSTRDASKYNAIFPPVLDYIARDFKVYVNESSAFKSRLPRLEDMIVSSYRIGDRWNDNKVYYRIVFAMYCAIPSAVAYRGRTLQQAVK